MSFHDCLVVQRTGDWLIVVGSESETMASDVTNAELVTCVELMIQRVGVKNPSCVLAPASTSCFFAMIHADEEIDVRDRAALTFELEDHLPIDAESMVADFVVVPSIPDSKNRVAAVAVEIRDWQSIADAFESAQIPVRSIVPAAVLVTRSVCRGSNLADTIEFVLVDESQCDIVTLQSETIVAWKHMSLDPVALQRHRLLAPAAPDRIVVMGAEPTQQSTIRDAFGDIEVSTESIQSHEIQGAALAMADQSQRWFDLRRDQLGPSDSLRPIQTQLRLVTLAATACLLAIVVGGWWRTRRIETAITDVRSQQQQLFERAFPDARVPGALLRRVRSEHARVMGSRGASSQVEIPQSATEVLRELLAALPENVRFRIKSIDILNGQVDIDLQVRSPVDAGALATSLSTAGFDVKPPVTTQKDAKTFDSLLEAEWRGRNDGAASRNEVSIRISFNGEITG